nr:hypothetical protein [Tanacetum cinerariifolium]
MNPQTSYVKQVIPQVAYQSPLPTVHHLTESPFVDSSFVVYVSSPGDDPIACLHKAMAFLTTVASSRVTMQQVQGRQGQTYSGAAYMSNDTSSRGNTASGHARVVKCYNFQGERHMARQCTQPKRPRNAAWYKEKAMLAEAQEAGQMLDEEQLEFLTDLGIPANQAQTIIPHNDDMIKENLALKEKVDSLEQNISKQIKEYECLLETFNVFQNESKEKENKYMENEIDLEKKIKEPDNIVYKVGQSVQTVHMLTKPQSFYDNVHKQAPGYQNPFYLKKAQRIKPTLYDGIVISEKHVSMHVIDDEETLILEEESQSKMSIKEKDPEAIKQNISHKPIDYEKLNRLTEDFRKRFTPQQELPAKQAFWLRISNPTIESSSTPPVRVEVPSELPKVSLVNESLKKLKFQVAQFDSVVKKITIPNALTEDDWTRLFQSMFNKCFNPPTIAISPVQEAAAPRAEVLANSYASTSIDQDAPSTSTPSTQEQEREQSPIISQGFEESLKTPTFQDDPLNESPHKDSTSQASSSNMRKIHTPFEHPGR